MANGTSCDVVLRHSVVVVAIAVTVAVVVVVLSKVIPGNCNIYTSTAGDTQGTDASGATLMTRGATRRAMRHRMRLQRVVVLV